MRKLRSGAKVKAAAVELTQLKAEHESHTKAVRRATDERDASVSKVAAATQAASSEARLTSRAEAAETRASTSNILKDHGKFGFGDV